MHIKTWHVYLRHLFQTYWFSHSWTHSTLSSSSRVLHLPPPPGAFSALHTLMFHFGHTTRAQPSMLCLRSAAPFSLCPLCWQGGERTSLATDFQPCPKGSNQQSERQRSCTNNQRQVHTRETVFSLGICKTFSLISNCLRVRCHSDTQGWGGVSNIHILVDPVLLF